MKLKNVVLDINEFGAMVKSPLGYNSRDLKDILAEEFGSDFKELVNIQIHIEVLEVDLKEEI